MPRILVFAPCERIAISENDNSTSLLGIIQGYTVSADLARSPAEQAQLPMRWAIVILWHLTNEEFPKDWDVSCIMEKPSGKLSFEGTLPLNARTNFQRNSFYVNSFPVGEAGTYTIRIFLAEQGKERQEVANYPIEVRHLPNDQLIEEFNKRQMPKVGTEPSKDT